MNQESGLTLAVGTNAQHSHEFGSHYCPYHFPLQLDPSPTTSTSHVTHTWLHPHCDQKLGASPVRTIELLLRIPVGQENKKLNLPQNIWKKVTSPCSQLSDNIWLVPTHKS